MTIPFLTEADFHGAHYFEALGRHQATQNLMPADPRPAATLSDLPF